MYPESHLIQKFYFSMANVFGSLCPKVDTGFASCLILRALSKSHAIVKPVIGIIAEGQMTYWNHVKK